MAMIYNDPNASPSSVGTQFTLWKYQKQALIDLVKLQFFTQLADVATMPKNMGKKIKRYHYMPLLDDRNINDQGIDADGVVLVNTTYTVNFPSNALIIANAGSAAAVTAINDALDAASDIATDGADDSGGTGFTIITLTATEQTYETMVKADLAADDIGGVVSQNSGNLYGSAKDVGTIAGKMPVLSEMGGNVNRVGFTRIELEGVIEKFGFYDQYTQESLDFDTDAELQTHINREMLRGANEITEDALQIDLLNGAGVIVYPGVATSNETITGETGAITEVTYEDLMNLSIELDNNRCPKNTKIIVGSRMIDTRVVNGARYMYIGSELIPTIQKMTNHFSNAAFIPIAQYADAGTIANGEIGTVGDFRIIVVPEMMNWTGAGAIETVSNAGYRATNGKYDVFPMLVVGDASFTTIGFQTDGKTTKFKIKHSAPGSPESYANDKFGETGFMSIKWYYGSMLLRTERLALIKTVAQL